jgi:hypothetical protein
MVYTITNDGFAENAVYHATCITKYLLKRIKDDSEDYLTSEHDNLFQSFISTIKDDLLIHKKIFSKPIISNSVYHFAIIGQCCHVQKSFCSLV